MIVDPVQAMASLVPLATSTTLSPTSSVSPIPTVVPTLPEYQKADEVGKRTLW